MMGFRFDKMQWLTLAHPEVGNKVHIKKKNHSYKVTTSTCWRVDPLLTNTDYSVSALWPFPRAVIMWPPESLDMRKKPPEGK